MSAPYYINPAPATLDACFAELTRLGNLRELGRIPDADYYAADASLTARIAELDSMEAVLPEADAELVAGLFVMAEAEARYQKAHTAYKDHDEWDTWMAMRDAADEFFRADYALAALRAQLAAEADEQEAAHV